jgi:RNA chaperone Hfq
MKKATSQQFNIQDQKLNESRKEGKIVSIRLLDGVELTGLVSSYDQFTIAFLVPNPLMDLLIYKHAIAYIKFNS